MILVTGGTGTVGRGVVRRLLQGGAAVRALARDHGRLEELRRLHEGEPLEVMAGSLSDLDAVAQALQGARRVFLLSCADPPELQAVRVVAKAVREAATVEAVVNLSCLHAAPKAGCTVLRWHGEADALAEQSGVPILTLKPGYFLTNLLAVGRQIRDGDLPNPFRDAVFAVSDPAEVSYVVAEVLLAPAFASGRRDLWSLHTTFPSLAETLMPLLGRPVRALAATWDELHPAFADPRTPDVIRSAGREMGEWIAAGNFRGEDCPRDASAERLAQILKRLFVEDVPSRAPALNLPPR